MKKPIIFALDDDPQVLRAVTRDLKSEYRSNYRIMSTDSANDALEALVDLKKKSETIALFLVDQRMPEMLGVEFLTKAKAYYPKAKKVLLTAYSDTDAAIKAINDVQLDYYLTKPWNPPEEKLYPTLDDLLDVWQLDFQPEFDGIKVLGYQFSPKSHDIKDFLSANLFPFQWLDVENNEKAKEIINLYGLTAKDMPVVSLQNGECLKNPNIVDIAVALGLNAHPKDNLYDVVIIGAGPSGLAAAVYGGSEGLKTLLIEKHAPGGQAGTSSRIENYLGFPNGLSGQELTHRAITQAKRFGIEFLSPQEVTSISEKDGYKNIMLGNGESISTKSVVITTGVNYRKLDSEGIEEYTGAGIYYGSSMTEAQACHNKEVYIVGGGNSAGQSAVYLSKFAKNVHIVIRKKDLSSSMSSYLIDQIDAIENIIVLGHTNITKAIGKNERLQELKLSNSATAETKTVKADALFIFIGARPYTDWLALDIIKNERGFIETGRDLTRYDNFRKIWKKDREPFLLETCSPGIFASGDVRAGAMNRVASAVGEGAMAIKFVHEYLAER
ncbi:fused response regulator/thioredoxin-disulfide reductase [Aquimarina aggregata]|uniref:Fused response regulator/thioredoxin-disulfide reductase n=1 Tax=Aquimarina aggregata TaxID=1642818 RepID=A0A163BCK7_9FLAO|nr:FAD-dependent oxidoreductase [Aquimarina aggregata]KZS41255.1 fused response regulator/thioredoxin-disulfide reductase [Aquimarina aggregata]